MNKRKTLSRNKSATLLQVGRKCRRCARARLNKKSTRDFVHVKSTTTTSSHLTKHPRHGDYFNKTCSLGCDPVCRCCTGTVLSILLRRWRSSVRATRTGSAAGEYGRRTKLVYVATLTDHFQSGDAQWFDDRVQAGKCAFVSVAGESLTCFTSAQRPARNSYALERFRASRSQPTVLVHFHNRYVQRSWQRCRSQTHHVLLGPLPVAGFRVRSIRRRWLRLRAGT